MQRDGLAIVPSAGSAGGDRDRAGMAAGEDADDFFGGDGLHDGFGGFVVEQGLEDGGVPVEVARKTLNDERLGEDARGRLELAGCLLETGGEGGEVVWDHGLV